MYFRQNITKGGIKLPIKWMALESIHDAVFSEKSDVVRRGDVHMQYEAGLRPCGYSCRGKALHLLLSFGAQYRPQAMSK